MEVPLFRKKKRNKHAETRALSVVCLFVSFLSSLQFLSFYFKTAFETNDNNNNNNEKESSSKKKQKQSKDKKGYLRISLVSKYAGANAS